VALRAQVLFYVWNKHFPLFQIYNSLMLKGTGTDGQLPPELADRVLVRSQRQDFKLVLNPNATSH
jgi:hypothetical protein